MGKVTSQKGRMKKRVPILLIEDNADQWLIIRSALSQCIPELEPVWINNAAQSLTYLENCSLEKNNIPRLILMELYLPHREEGLALLASIKSHPFYRQVPVIVLSHSEAYKDIVETYQYSIASYISKPSTYHQWLVGFYTFRRYWWDWVSLSFRSSQGDSTHLN
ncbi:CheY chemotaxis protein or a CheY-like REC (receiver) domain [Spirosoma endophyticum]|uniref:CheY chemotaxis protein or a CheY-like REC (Receiver) domain n=2 Tax=Spirosoma endophyticum TaxID=662367 RepID=A0A1I1ZB15_9BACT|nr:CheY chemotaxis protein or a CheY-like REC (receiver) domain [Spirosoma endophyticum]